MASDSAELKLNPDEFAFYFSSDAGIEASELGTFLQRAATVARRQGAELRVTAIEGGSLAVVLKALAKSTARAARDEFNSSPVRTTGAGVGIVGAVVTAIVYAMAPQPGQVTPLAKEGAKIVQEQHVNRIEVVTINETVVVMDEQRANVIRELELHQKRLEGREVEALIADARRGPITGAIFNVAGEAHFRPDGYRYLVPVDLSRSEGADELRPDQQYRVKAEFTTYRGQPDTVIIHSADRL